MNIDKFDQKIRASRKRVAELLQSNDNNCKQQLLSEAFKELQGALEDLETALEELRQQNEEIEAAQVTLETQCQRYQDLFEFAPDGYLVTDDKGIIREANCAAATLLKSNSSF